MSVPFAASSSGWICESVRNKKVKDSCAAAANVDDGIAAAAPVAPRRERN
jgi:hypothetical protein